MELITALARKIALADAQAPEGGREYPGSRSGMSGG
jgi:hypothetical protein